MRALRLFVPLFCATSLLVATARAANGDLDSGFHSPFGYSTYAFDLGNGGNNADYTQAVLVQSSGNVVLVGRSISGASSDVIALTRLLPDGSLDNSFGTGGATTFSLASGAYNSGEPYVNAAALDTQGRILITGSTATDDCSYIARFTANGLIDNSFATGGVYVACPAAGFYIRFWDIAVDSSSRPVVAGVYATLNGDLTVSSDLLAFRLTSTGQPDTGFNGGSFFTRSVGYVANSKDRAGAVAFDSAGRIYLGGAAQQATDDAEVVLRLTSAGVADNSCGSSGVANLGAVANSGFFPTAVLLRDAHHVFLAGTSTNNNNVTQTAVAYAELDADTCAPGSSGITIPASGSAMAARAAAASDGAVYLSYSQLTSTQVGAPRLSAIQAFYDTLPYNGSQYGIYSNQNSYGQGINLVGGRPLQALEQQYSGADYDFAVARFENDRIFYGNFDRDGAKATF
jgi:uncharacterized delta-60 repeat protein